MKKKSKKRKVHKERKERCFLSLEAKVRAMKLLKVDNWDPRVVLEDLESTFGVKIEQRTWDDPGRLFQKIEEELQELYLKIGPHRPRLVKLLLQAQLIEKDTFIQGDQNGRV
jgi:hypothetical protein